jgi:hypothetical protein
MVSTGIPAEYAAVLRPPTATVASGNGPARTATSSR